MDVAAPQRKDNRAPTPRRAARELLPILFRPGRTSSSAALRFRHGASLHRLTQKKLTPAFKLSARLTRHATGLELPQLSLNILNNVVGPFERCWPQDLS